MAIATTLVNNNPQLNEINTRIYNGQKYQIDIVFDNLQGNRFQLNLASVVDLEIEEDSRDWYRVAALTIKNPDNLFEKKLYSSDTPDKYYKFRNDGRDIVYIAIKPIDDDTLKDSNLQIDYDVWGMSYAFSIYDRKEIVGETSKQKQLKLYLWEYEHQIMSEYNLPVSSNELLPASIVPAYATDEQKLVNTGNVIKLIINKSLQNYINPAPVFNKDWDVGSSKIFYTAPANYTAANSLEYLIKKHVSSQIGSNGGADPCILSRTRFTKQWRLVSYSNFFSRAVKSSASTRPGIAVPEAGDLQREIITVADQTGDRGNEYSFALPNSPVRSTSYLYTNYQNPITSTIKNLHIVDMSTIDNAFELITTPCYSNNHKNKTFSVDFANNTIESVKNFIDINYTNKFKLYSKPDTLLTLNKTKTDTHSVRNVHSLSPDKISQLAEARNFLLAGAVFYNTSLNFEAIGSVIREASTFISVESESGGVLNEYSDKLLGQWMVYKVVHKFTDTDYTNNITAVRVHANENINIDNNIA